RPAAAKTGTTQDWRDNWTVGYSPDLVVGVWAGNADNEPMRNVSGVTGAAPIWHDIMETLHKTRPVHDFARPDGLVEVTVCNENGLLPIDREAGQLRQDFVAATTVSNTELALQATQLAAPCPHTISEKFIDGTAPQRFDDWHQTVALDRRNNLLAGPGCSLDFVTLQAFTRYPSEAQAWATGQGVSPIPDIYSPLCPQPNALNLEFDSSASPDSQSSPLPASSPLIFTSPDPGTVFRLAPDIPADKQKVRISLRPADGVFVDQITLLVNGQPLANDWDILWQMTPGEYIFEAVGVDRDGQELLAEAVKVTVVE
ncbi:MAG: hypothetical protein AAF485_26390, partial [Chloroflexota bacterium]